MNGLGRLGRGFTVLALHTLVLALAWAALPEPKAKLGPAKPVQLTLIASPSAAVKPAAIKPRPAPQQRPVQAVLAMALTPVQTPSLLAPSLAPPVLAAAAPQDAQTSSPINAAPPPSAQAIAEPPLQAAAPPDRRCADQQIARHYPAMLRERGIEGRVLLRVRVDEQGQATDIQVLGGGSGWRLLDEAARLLTQACRFQPARRGEQPLASWVEYPVRFALNQSAADLQQ